MNAPKPIPFKPEPPQPLMRDISQGLDYPVQSLGPLRSVVEAVQGMTQAPIAIPAASALTVASLATQGFSDVQTLGGVRPLSLYALTIARSGERKSSCDGPLLTGLREHEREQALVYRDAVATWQNVHALWKGDRDRILAIARKANGEEKVGAQGDLEALGKEPAAPPTGDRTATEPTFEGLTQLYMNGQPSLGIFSDEGGQFLGGHAMNNDNRQKTLAALNDLWQGNPIRRTRAGDGHATLFGRRLAVHLMVQPKVAQSFMSDPMAVDTGFLPRFLICEPPSNIGSRLHRYARRDETALQAFSNRLKAILETPLPMNPDTRELSPGELDLAPDAEAILIDFADEVESAQAPQGHLSHVSGFASKAAEQAARIAGVLSMWRNLDVSTIGAEDMANGISLARYYLSEAQRLVDSASISREIDRAETLRKWLLESWQHPEVMVRDVVRYGPNSLRESPKARSAIDTLLHHGWLTSLEPGTIVRGSARKEVWRIWSE